jgi:hypothetical protein
MRHGYILVGLIQHAFLIMERYMMIYDGTIRYIKVLNLACRIQWRAIGDP